MTRRQVVALVALLLAAFPIPRALAECHEITFAGAPYSVGESAGKVTISVSNGGGAQSTDQSVDYHTIDATAKAGSDYQKTSGTLTIPTGSDEATFDVPIKNDTKDETAERFMVQLSNVSPPSSCVPPPFISQQTTTVTIQDNDEKPITLPSVSHSPTPTKTSTPKPKPSTASPSPSPSPTSPTPTSTASPIAAPASGDGGLPGGALAGIVAATVVGGGAAAFWVRRRFLT